MRCLVLGGAGYIGSTFVWRAKDLGHSVMVYDDLSRGHQNYLPLDVEFIREDVCNTDALRSTIRSFKPDAIMHFAAYALVPESVANPEMYFRNNVGGVLSLCHASREENFKGCIVFSSTCAVFGTPSKVPIAENDPKSHTSPYGLSKKMCEEILAETAAKSEFKVICLRYFNACGADLEARCGEDHDPETHLIPNILSAVSSGSTLKIYGNDYPTRDGTCIRDYIHVVDLADAHLEAAKALNTGKKLPPALHIGSGLGISNLEMLTAAERILGLKAKFEFLPRRPGDPAELICDPTLASQTLDFKAKFSDVDKIISTANAWTKVLRQNSSHAS